MGPDRYESLPRAFSTTSGVMGWVVTRALKGARASLMAFSTAAGAPATPASPAPLKLPSENAVRVSTAAPCPQGPARVGLA